MRAVRDSARHGGSAQQLQHIPSLADALGHRGAGDADWARDPPAPPGRDRPRRSPPLRLKIVSLGAPGTGKSCLIKRYCEERHVPKYVSTIGVDYGVKAVKFGALDARLNLWDLAGGPDYYAIRCEFYRDAQGALLVYDVTDRDSFAALDAWLEEAKRCGAPPGMAVVVAANKADSARRAVPESEGRAWAASRGHWLFETSAATGAGVRPAFATLFAEVLAATPGAPDDAVAAAAAAAVMEREGSVVSGSSDAGAPGLGRRTSAAAR